MNSACKITLKGEDFLEYKAFGVITSTMSAIEHELLQSCSLRGDVLARHEHGGGSFEV